MKILLAEDDRQTADYLRQGLLAEGYSVDHVPDGRDALVQATLQPYDLLVVDRMMPGLDGLSLVKALRSAQIKAPILILTAMGGVTDRVEGLQAGADDYLVKPFAFSELSARLAALARRPALAEGRAIFCGWAISRSTPCAAPSAAAAPRSTSSRANSGFSNI